MSKLIEHPSQRTQPPDPAPALSRRGDVRQLPDGCDVQPADLQVSELEIDGVVYHVVSHALGSEPKDAVTHALTALPGSKLTTTDREIADQILAGRSHAEIAQARGTSPRTVGKQVQLIYRKLGIQSRAELAALVASCRTSS